MPSSSNKHSSVQLSRISSLLGTAGDALRGWSEGMLQNPCLSIRSQRPALAQGDGTGCWRDGEQIKQHYSQRGSGERCCSILLAPRHQLTFPMQFHLCLDQQVPRHGLGWGERTGQPLRSSSRSRGTERGILLPRLRRRPWLTTVTPPCAEEAGLMLRKALASSSELMPSVGDWIYFPQKKLRGRAAGAAAPGSQVGPSKPCPEDKAVPSCQSHVSPGEGRGPFSSC